jgi:hypothetical protein
VALSWRASLLYAVVAILAGSLFVAAAYYADSADSWALEDRRVYGFLFVYGLTLAGAAPALLAFAGTVRMVTRLLRWTRPGQWLVAGGIAGLVVPWALGALGYAIDGWYFPAELQRLKRSLVFPLMGPMMYASQPVWVRMAIGLATSAVLWAVVRATTRSRSPAARA